MKQFKTVDEYLKNFPDSVKEKLEELRSVIKKVSPGLTETISYGIPTYKFRGKNLVHFGGFKNHVGFYPTPGGITEFEKDLDDFITGKGTLQFPLDKPLPLTLIRRIVEFRIKQLEN